MQRNGVWKKVLPVMATGLVLTGLAGSISGCGKKHNQMITLDVLTETEGFSGMQSGWIADILKKKFNVKLNIISNTDGMFKTQMEDENLGDIVIFKKDSDQYAEAVKNGLLFDWNKNHLLKKKAPYIYKHMKNALKKNSELTKQITDGKSDVCYGIGNNIAVSDTEHQAFLYTWDLRWDLYKELGYPKVRTLEDFANLLEDMQKICPKDDMGDKTYAVSLWPDWDVDSCMCVRAAASAWYGYDELGMGLYDSETGNYFDVMMEDGPYLEMLQFYNCLFQKGLVDTDSMTQTYAKAIEKTRNGGVLFSFFNYSGSLAYNQTEHTEKGKFMYCMAPEDARPIVYGISTGGGDEKTCLGAKTDYPELCMKVLNYFATPEGHMTFKYGPKGVCWDYDEEGNTYFTEFGLKCNKDGKTKMRSGYKGTYEAGVCQADFSSWADDAENPDSNGETYNFMSWRSNQGITQSKIGKDWMEYNQCSTLNEYFENRIREDGSKKFLFVPETSFQTAEKDSELKKIWSQVATEIKNGSWKAIYAKSDKEFGKIVREMIHEANRCGYERCVQWGREQAAERFRMEESAGGL